MDNLSASYIKINLIYLLAFPGFFYLADSNMTYYTNKESDIPDYDGFISI